MCGRRGRSSCARPPADPPSSRSSGARARGPLTGAAITGNGRAPRGPAAPRAAVPGSGLYPPGQSERKVYISTMAMARPEPRRGDPDPLGDLLDEKSLADEISKAIEGNDCPAPK